MSEALTMSKKERTRAHFYRLLANGTMTVSEVSEHLAISERQCYRMKARYRARGDAGLIHTLRGRPSNRGYKKGDRTRVIELYQKRYEDYGPTLFAERVEEDLQLAIDPETLRRWLLAAGVWHRARKGRRPRGGRPGSAAGFHHPESYTCRRRCPPSRTSREPVCRGSNG